MPRPTSLSSDADEWLVHADELLGKGDRLGELIIAQVNVERGGSAEREKALFVELSASLGVEQLSGARATWRRGHLASFHAPAVPALERLLRLRAAELVEEIVIDNALLEIAEQCGLVASRAPRSLQSVVVRTRTDQFTYTAPIPFGRLLAIPGLRSLSVDAVRVELGRGGTFPHLESLHWGSEDLRFDSLERWTFPGLRELTLHVWQHRRGRGPRSAWEGARLTHEWPSVDPLKVSFGERLLSREAAPRLEQLTLLGFEISTESVGQLLRFVDRGVTIDLTSCSLTDGVRRALEGIDPARLRCSEPRR